MMTAFTLASLVASEPAIGALHWFVRRFAVAAEEPASGSR
jgi:hypothetical protein